MRIVTLVENTRAEGREDLTPEHGLSLYVERDDQRILFDTGATQAFRQNAERLDVDIAGVDAAVISHHHYHHGGGLPYFLEANHCPRETGGFSWRGREFAGAATAMIYLFPSG